MFEWLTGTVIGKMCATFFISMLPVVELRFGLPYGIALGLEYPFEWMRKHMPRMNALVTKLENRAHLKGETVEKYGHWGLLIFVAIPLPGTGAWTGALIAALLNIRTSKAVPVILIGVCIAAAIMTLITYGVIHIVV